MIVDTKSELRMHVDGGRATECYSLEVCLINYSWWLRRFVSIWECLGVGDYHTPGVEWAQAAIVPIWLCSIGGYNLTGTNCALRDTSLVVSWWEALEEEEHLKGPPQDRSRASARRRLRRVRGRVLTGVFLGFIRWGWSGIG
ncbi:hypothetical protein CRENBAI_009981 [Crenichthys baileyi]|uniref:Uncharacterized protein n=1 Tax=Crenichthys baileyi TaxID=28760 RepID=A0AAV9SC03_9TELE